MLVTQNKDGSLSVEIPYADVASAVKATLSRVPVSHPTLVLQIVSELESDFGYAVRSANLTFDQPVTDTVAVAVQALADTRATVIAGQQAPVIAPVVAGP